MGLSLLIVVLHYSGLDDTLECLASLGRQACPEAHTIVVDNGSAERAGPRIAALYPWAEMVELAENQGWAGGNNAGIRVAMERGYDLVCLLNNDTVIPDGAIAALLRTAACLGPCLLHPAIDSYGADDQVQLDPTIPQPPNLAAMPVPAHAGVYDIDIVSGCCLLVHLAVLKSIGLIDERFFLLCEDTDLGQRAVAAGYRMFCDASVRIQHKESRSFGGRRKPIKTYYGFRNVMLYHEKHRRIFLTFPRLARDLAWLAWGTAEAAGKPPGSWWGLLRWSVSSDSFARAARAGMRDYLLRRFGRINRRDEAILTASPEGF